MKKSEERFKDLSERTSDWIWELDTEGRYIYSSPVSEEVLGYRPKEIIGRHFSAFFRDKEKGRLKDLVHDSLSKKGTVVAFEHFLVSPRTSTTN